VEDEQEELSSPSDKQLTYAEWLDEMCAFYMSIGVSYDEYWHGNYAKLQYYYKAYEMRQKRDSYKTDYEAWLQGAYNYEAVCDASPLFNPFAKKETKAHPYPQQPHSYEKLKSPEEKRKEFFEKWENSKKLFKEQQKRKKERPERPKK
jgi:hypothetical protein